MLMVAEGFDTFFEPTRGGEVGTIRDLLDEDRERRFAFGQSRCEVAR
jgi:hypothetical protein